MELLSSKEFEKTILFYYKKLDGSVDPISIAAVILLEISRTFGEETPSSLEDSLPMEHLLRDMRNILKKAKKFIDDDEYTPGSISDEYWQYIGEDLAHDYDELRGTKDDFDPNIFHQAIYELKNKGHAMYITNWRKYRNGVWNTYKKIKGYPN